MALAPAITELEQLTGHPAVARLLAWNRSAIENAKFDREELTIYVERSSLREACVLLRDDPNCPFNFLSDVTCVDWYPAEPRFEVVYHVYSIQHGRRLRLKVRVDEGQAVPTVTEVWPTANWHEREVSDLFGVPFAGHPDLRRILMPDDWEGHPLRKDYPVEASPRWWEEEPA
jgi:NADH-quinone oxidoreductase subunit C